ncbi:hypothetical protein [uncultured Clostridium sp.]|uniref:TIGR03943 family putative permease subunit n=1 Tax=Clostridium sp. TaxID=1506 RepID=UPI0025E9B317|nr:hypothetical protein [uncultured Clostridium sp.]
MKKFNIDELIWFIILILLDLSVIFLIRSGNITNFVSSDMIIYFYLSIIILTIFALFQFSRIFTIKRRIETTNKFIPLTFTLCIGVILLYIFPLLKQNENTNENLLFKNHTDAIIINNDNYDIVNEIIQHKDEYEGKAILFLGYIDNTKESSDFIVISRQMIKCCQADKEKIQIKAKGIKDDLEEGQWINIYGRICFDDDFYILVEEYKMQDEPNDIYFHDHL